MQRSFYEVDSIEAPWNSGIDTEDDGTPNIAFKNRVKKGYFPVPPIDHTQDLRDDMVATRWQALASRRSTTASTPCSTQAMT